MSGALLDPALDRILLAARDKRERRGGAGDSSIVLRDLDPHEALALDALLAVSVRRRPVLPGQTLRLKLSELEAALRACSVDPRLEYERVGGRPLRDLPAERAAARHRRESFSEWLLSHELVSTRPGLADSLERAVVQGRIHSNMRPLVEAALRVVAALPATKRVQRSVLAAQLLDGDPHALDVGTPLHNLVVSLLIADANLDPDTSPRNVWAHFNVLADPVASNAVTLGLPLLGDGVAARLVRAAAGGHVVLTYGQLTMGGFAWPPGTPCFTCENPSVLIAAEQELGTRCRPLICTGGHPSDAVRLLLTAVANAGGTIRHHGDFDEAGLLIMRDLRERYGAASWRFDLASLNAALDANRCAGTSSVSSLEEVVGKLVRPLPEELELDILLSDLST